MRLSGGQLEALIGKMTDGRFKALLMGALVTAVIQSSSASIGTNRNARRAALVYLCFNFIGASIFIVLFCILSYGVCEEEITMCSGYLGGTLVKMNLLT